MPESVSLRELRDAMAEGTDTATGDVWVALTVALTAFITDAVVVDRPRPRREPHLWSRVGSY